MNFNTFYKILPAPMLGLVALVLRAQLYAYGLDEWGLIPENHPYTMALLGLAVLVVAYAVITVWKEKGTKTYEGNFSASVPAAVGSWVLAAAVLIWGREAGEDALAMIEALHTVLALLCAAALAYAGYCRFRGTKPFFGCCGVVSLFFAIHAVACYQTWSSNPQMLDYIFALLGCVCLMLYAYQQTAFAVGMGSRRGLIGLGLAGSSFCLASVPQEEFAPIYVAGALWMLTNLCDLSTAERK